MKGWVEQGFKKKEEGHTYQGFGRGASCTTQDKKMNAGSKRRQGVDS